jgi:hypothetical protein
MPPSPPPHRSPSNRADVLVASAGTRRTAGGQLPFDARANRLANGIVDSALRHRRDDPRAAGRGRPQTAWTPARIRVHRLSTPRRVTRSGSADHSTCCDAPFAESACTSDAIPPLVAATTATAAMQCEVRVSSPSQTPHRWTTGRRSRGERPAQPGAARRAFYSATLTPEPPISFGISFILGNPSLIRSFVS